MKKNSKTSLPAEKKPKKNLLGKILLILLMIAVFMFIYALSLKFFFYEIVITAYYVILGAAILTIFFLNRGFSLKPTPHEELPGEWNHIEKQNYLDREKKRIDISKKLVFIILPLIVVLFIDVIDLYYIDIFKNIFGGGSVS